MESGERYVIMISNPLEWLLIHSCAQGTALFMAGDLLDALTDLEPHNRQASNSDFTFRHRLCDDFESLIWVVVYAMMIHHKNHLAGTDPEACALYKETLDECWAVHSYGNLHRSHVFMIATGCTFKSRHKVSSWFPDPREAAFSARPCACSAIKRKMRTLSRMRAFAGSSRNTFS